MTLSNARRSMSNCAKSASAILRFTKSVLRSKMYLSSFRPNTPRTRKRPHDENDCHPERSEGPHRWNARLLQTVEDHRSKDDSGQFENAAGACEVPRIARKDKVATRRTS